MNIKSAHRRHRSRSPSYPLAASAGPIENRGTTSKGRIDQGVHNGSLTYGRIPPHRRRLDQIQTAAQSRSARERRSPYRT